MKRHDKITLALAIGTGLAAMLLASPDADAAPGDGCETTPRPVLLNWIQKRTICDGPIRPDGSWERTRAIWTPAHTSNGYCSGSAYYVTCSPARYYGETVQEFERYPVTPENVLPDEPGHIPAGSVVLR